MITSTANQQVKYVMKLQKTRKARQEAGVFLVEGIRMFREIPKEWFQKAYVTEDWLEVLPADWQEELHYEIVSSEVFKAMSETQTPQGLLAIVTQPEYTREQLMGTQKACILVLENLQDPGNLGTILRTAEGAGVTGVMMSRETVDIYNPKVVRATMGAIFRMPFRYEETIADGIAWLKERDVTCYAAHLKGEDFYRYDYTEPCCFLIGNEGNGLTEATALLADERIRIPMAGNVESLNAATATTVLVYEAMRQRHQKN